MPSKFDLTCPKDRLLDEIETARQMRFGVIPIPGPSWQVVGMIGAVVYFIVGHLERAEAHERARRMNAGRGLEGHLWN